METQIDQQVIDTVCNSLRASRQSLTNQLAKAPNIRQEAIITCQLQEVKKALEVFQILES